MVFGNDAFFYMKNYKAYMYDLFLHICTSNLFPGCPAHVVCLATAIDVEAWRRSGFGLVCMHFMVISFDQLY